MFKKFREGLYKGVVAAFKASNHTSKKKLNYVYILDAGHGGIDSKGVYVTPGKRSPETDDKKILYEGELNRDLANKVKDKLLKEYNVSVPFVHEEINDTPLTTRVKSARKIAAENDNKVVYISIHSNAYGTTWNSAHGWEVYFSELSNSLSEDVCKIFSEEFKKEFPNERNRGIKKANYQVIKNTEYPAVLLENFFMTNLEECESYLFSELGRGKLANYIVNAIVRIDAEIKI